jgi:hypothetical protein
MRMSESRQRAFELLVVSGFTPSSAEAALAALERGGPRFADATRAKFVCRWVDVAQQPVPPTADTIIRTVTRTTAERSVSRTHWLEGIVEPPFRS